MTNHATGLMKIEYDSLAQEYAQHRRSDAAAVERLISGSGIWSASRVLEIGCGTGNYIAELHARLGCQCHGVDPSSGMVAQARLRDPVVTYSVAPAEHLGLTDASFDLAFSVDVIHHVENPAACFQEAYRVLKPGGLLATLTDSEDTIRRRIPLAFYFPETVECELKRYPTVERLRAYSEQASFEVIAQEIVEQPYELRDAESYAQRAFSCLRLIPEAAFAAGIARLTQDLEKGPIPCVSRNYVLWNKKNAPGSASCAEDPLPPPPEMLSHEAVKLRFVKVVVPEEASRGLVPHYHFRVLTADGTDVGHINFRVGDTEHVRLSAGHIGFEILEPFRGQGYALQACQAIAPFVRSVYTAVLLTCDPENHASRRTIERLGASYLGEIVVPTHDPQYQRGSPRKRRYQWNP